MHLKRPETAASEYSTENEFFGLIASFVRLPVRAAARCNQRLHLHPSSPDYLQHYLLTYFSLRSILYEIFYFYLGETSLEFDLRNR